MPVDLDKEIKSALNRVSSVGDIKTAIRWAKTLSIQLSRAKSFDDSFNHLVCSRLLDLIEDLIVLYQAEDDPDYYASQIFEVLVKVRSSVGIYNEIYESDSNLDDFKLTPEQEKALLALESL